MKNMSSDILRLGDKVAEIGYGNSKHGVIVRIDLPSLIHHGMVYVWLENQVNYGSDNCEHFAYHSDLQLSTVLKKR